jgi:transcription elongation factor GreA
MPAKKIAKKTTKKVVKKAAKAVKPAKAVKVAVKKDAIVVKSADELLVVTKEGYKALEKELEQLKTVRRRQVAERLKEAISYGDLSENSEYEEAKNEQAFVEGRILEVENMIRNAKVVDEKHHSKKVVEIGTKVKIVNIKKKTEEYEFTIVGSTEADPFSNRVSNESPVGSALLGSKQGDKIVVDAPAGKAEYEVKKLS